MELRTFADWVVRVRLLGTPGVARVETFGGEVRQLQVQFKPERLLAYGLSVEDVLDAARNSTGVRGAGFIENDNQRLTLRTSGQAITPELLGNAVLVHRNGVSVRLKDVAAVVLGPAPRLGDGLVNGKPGVVMLVDSQYGANTLEVTDAVERALAQLQPSLAAAKVTLYPSLFRPANFIEASIANITRALAIGGVLVLAMLFLFLANLRGALIAFITIPLSLLAAIIVLEASGASLNTITLGGLAISIGVVIDDAIIGLENVWRRLRENRALTEPRSPLAVVLDATLEVRSPVVYATFIVATVFWPVLMMSGINGRLFAPLAIAFLLAIFASLVIAVTLTPALCCTLLPAADFREPAYITRLKERHRQWLAALARRPRAVIVTTTCVCVAAAATLPFFGGEFLPDFKEGHYVLRTLMAPGTSLQTSRRIGSAIAQALLKIEDIRSVSQAIGRAEQGEDTNGAEFSEWHVELKPEHRDEDVVKEQIRATLRGFPGVAFAVTPFLGERIEEVLSGARGEVVVNLFGSDLGVLDRKAQEVRRIVAGTRGAVDVFLQSQSGSPELAITLRPDRLRQFGFQPVNVLEAVHTAYQGTTVAQTYENERVFDVSVILDPASRSDADAVGALLARNSEGLQLPLRELADIDFTSGRHVIEHEGTLRLRQVTCDVEDRDVASFVGELKRRIAAQLTLPPDVTLAYAGAAEAERQARLELLLHSLIVAVVIAVLLSLVFHDARSVLLVLANLPFALTGGVAAVVLSGGSLSVGSLVGFIALFGISMRNSILLMSHYENLVLQEGQEWNLQTAIRGAGERVVPILMTALVVALGLLPIALQAEQAGKEIEGPMAIVILGGLTTSTVLNLMVLPTLALRYARFKKS
jgi:CzcA family heavy metal efflux pump